MPHKPSDIVLLTFGPVQTFISASRRTQDLAISSLILSSLAKSALLEIEKQSELELIFPLRSGSEWARRLPNRIVFLTPQGTGQDKAKELCEVISIQWDEIASKVKNFLKKFTSQTGWETMWDSQVKEWLETYWVTTPWNGQDDTYLESFQTLNLGIDARKNIRHYPTSPQSGEKCTLSGIRSAVGMESRKVGIWPELHKKFRTHLRENERLSAISAVKRFADHAGALDDSLTRFPSTSSIAAASFKGTVLQNWSQLEPLVNDFYGSVDALGLSIFNEPEPFPYLQAFVEKDQMKKRWLCLEGDYLYKEFYRNLELVNEARREHLSPIPEGDAPPELQNAVRTLSALLKGAAECVETGFSEVPSPNTYYAALMMDGDHMGKIIDEAGSLKKHKEISQKMAETANAIQKLVEESYPGKLIYSSGDDVLALLPVNCVLQAAHKIRSIFVENMASINQKADMSGGISVMHHHSPLEAILSKARHAENLAKEKYNRQALVITILKRSGEDLSAPMKWLGPKRSDPVSLLLSYFTRGAISSKFIYDLRDEIPALLNNYKGLKLEMTRLVNQHLSPAIRKNEKEREKIAILIEDLVNFRDHIPTEVDDRFQELLNWLFVTRFLAQGERS